MKHLSGLIAILICFTNAVTAQEPVTSDLYKTLKSRDSLIFEIGFNKCQLGVYDSIISDDLEFYHDKGGVENGKTAFIASMKNGICSYTQKLMRELVPGTLKVYPLYKNNVLYGAVQEGAHTFLEFKNNQWEKTGIAKFTHLWLLENNVWKLKRVLSFDHKGSK